MVLKKITEILFCFRLNKIAMVADIEKKHFYKLDFMIVQEMLLNSFSWNAKTN